MTSSPHQRSRASRPGAGHGAHSDPAPAADQGSDVLRSSPLKSTYGSSKEKDNILATAAGTAEAGVVRCPGKLFPTDKIIF